MSHSGTTRVAAANRKLLTAVDRAWPLLAAATRMSPTTDGDHTDRQPHSETEGPAVTPRLDLCTQRMVGGAAMTST